MEGNRSGLIHALEFSCQSPLKFYEHCSACARFGEDCPDLKLGKDILRGKKKIIYAEDHSGEGVHASSFSCLAPLYYFEKSRSKCAHGGRCREEGLLLALLSGNKELVYTQKTAIEMPARKLRRKKAGPRKAIAKKATQ